MPAVSPKLDLLENLKSDIGIAEEVIDQVIELTPHLALAVALLYMIASDGEIEDQESSQLQSVLGGDKEVLRYGLAYVQSTSIEQFLQDAPEVLSHKDCLCILTNVCDSLLSDGHADDAELALFQRMVTALGWADQTFDPYFKTIALKNDKTVLGAYPGTADEITALSPHHALAIALLYMMTADGAIGSEEIGQLEAVIGEFEGLQKAALKYVRKTKVKQFLDQVTPSLTPEQRLYILTNVCDSMLSDGNVALLENKLFQTILTSFGYNETSFETYYQTIEIKNVKPFDTREFKPKITHHRRRETDTEEGIQFEKKLTSTDKGHQAPADAYNAAMGVQIQRTMQDNIEHVAEDFGSNDNIIQVGHNATDELNLQKLAQSLSADNVQQIDDGISAAENRQTLPTDSVDINIQTLALTQVTVNLQTIDADRPEDQSEELSVEVRMQTLYEGIDSLNQRLNRFERENKDFLDAIRAEMLIDVPGVVVDVSPEEQELLSMVDEMLRTDHVEQIALPGSSDNVQQIPILADTENVQHIPIADADDNIQDIALTRDVENIQTIALTSTEPNYQRIHSDRHLNEINFQAPMEAALLQTDLAGAPPIDSARGGDGAYAAARLLETGQTQDSASVVTHAAMPQARRLLAIGRYAPTGLNWFYAHAKVTVIFMLCVFAMPMGMTLPSSRITSGFLITLAAHSEHANSAKQDVPLDEHVVQQNMAEEVEQTFDQVRLKRN